MLQSTNKKQNNRRNGQTGEWSTKREVAVATPLGAIVTEPSVPRSVMTSQSTASFKVPKRKFKAKPGRAPLKTPASRSAFGCLSNERTEFEPLSRQAVGHVFVWSCIDVHA